MMTSTGPACGCSACRQNWIDTGETACITVREEAGTVVDFGERKGVELADGSTFALDRGSWLENGASVTVRFHPDDQFAQLIDA